MDFTYSVVIPTAGNYAQLYACLDSIVRCSDMTKTEIIVVNNGATDLTQDICVDFKAKLGDSFKQLFLSENKGFCIGTNLGMKMSSGKYVVWLNDDTIVTPNWLESLQSSIDTKHLYHDNIGLAGPLSNCVAGQQILKESMGMKPENLPEIIQLVSSIAPKYRIKTPENTWINTERLSGFLSGFCLMIKREVIDKIGYIDEQFSPGGFCDNDFVLRAIEAGYGAVVCYQTFVFHYGSKTLNTKYPEMRGGVRNWAKYIAKHRTKRDNKVVMIQRVKIDSDQQLSIFRKCAFVNENYVDGVIILSDKSEHKEFTEASCRKIFGKKLLQFATNAKTVPLNEIRDRMFLMNEAHKLDYDWVLVMDHDECFADGTDKERLKELMNPINPITHGYTFMFNNYWRGFDFARVDAPWGNAFFSRLYRNRIFKPSLRPMFDAADPGFHCGNRPLSIPENMFQLCDIVINHYGYTDSAEIERKYKYYTSLDKSPQDIKDVTVGSANYSHLINEIGLQVIVPKPFSISLNMMVKNEETPIGLQILQYAAIAREFVICDTGSTDKTMEYLDLAGIPYFQKKFDNDFSDIRNDLIKRSKYKYIMHVDADEQPEEFAMHKILCMLNSGPDVCLAALKTQHRDGRFQVVKQPRIFKNDPRFYYYGRVHETLDNALEKTGPITHGDTDLSIFNPGLLKDPSSIKRKLDFYGGLLELELKDHPDNYKAHFELALHYRNYGRLQEAKQLLEKCAKDRPGFLRAKIELILMEVNEGLDYLESCKGHKADEDVLKVLQGLHQSLVPWKYTPVQLTDEMEVKEQQGVQNV